MQLCGYLRVQIIHYQNEMQRLLAQGHLLLHELSLGRRKD